MATLPKYKIGTSQASTYAAITNIEKEIPQAKFTVRPNLKGEMIIHPKDGQSAQALETLLTNSTTVQATKLDPALKETKSVVLKYPKELPLEPILNHPKVLKAERCSPQSDKKVTTRQVVITHYGPSPASIDLKTWGKYEVRPYVPEPLRCYRCQKYGHHQSKCTYKETCAICALKHKTELCMEKLKKGEKLTAKCPNCGGKHHAWNPTCSERTKRVQASRPVPPTTTTTTATASQPAPTGTFVWGTQRRPQQQQKPPQQVNIQNRELFPGLPATSLPPRQQQPPVAPKKPTEETKTTSQPAPQGMIHVSDLSKVLTNFAEGLATLLGHKIQATQLSTLMSNVLEQVATAPAPATQQTAMLEPIQVRAEVHATPKEAPRKSNTRKEHKAQAPSTPRKKIDIPKPINHGTIHKTNDSSTSGMKKTSDHSDMEVMDLIEFVTEEDTPLQQG